MIHLKRWHYKTDWNRWIRLGPLDYSSCPLYTSLRIRLLPNVELAVGKTVGDAPFLSLVHYVPSLNPIFAGIPRVTTTHDYFRLSFGPSVYQRIDAMGSD